MLEKEPTDKDLDLLATHVIEESLLFAVQLSIDASYWIQMKDDGHKIVNINRQILGAWRDGHPGKPKIRELAQALHADPTEKANILNRQFQSAFSSEANTEIPDKGSSTHPIMKNISISKKGILNLININPKKAVVPDNIAGKILNENADICSDILTIIYKKISGNRAGSS